STSITAINEIFNPDEKYIQNVEKKEVEKRLEEIEKIYSMTQQNLWSLFQPFFIAPKFNTNNLLPYNNRLPSNNLLPSKLSFTFITDPIREIFNHLYEIPKTFESYKTIIGCVTLLNQTTENIIDMELMNKTLNANLKEKLITSLTCLNTLANDITYDRRISFIRYILNSSDKTKIILSNIPFTSGEINKHFREHALYFLPDKTGDYNAPISLR
ncbi:11118_t:CDS:1, partial [Gigaspora rosea]